MYKLYIYIFSSSFPSKAKMERGKKRFYTTKSKRGRPGESDEHKNVILVRVSVCPIFSSPSKELKKRKKKFLCAVNFL